MSLNKSRLKTAFSSLQDASPDYVSLVRFLVEPFLELPESLSIDCETLHAKQRVWIRLAFEGADKGRVFGRGGRNIQAIRTVIQAVAQAAGQFAHLDIYDETSGAPRRESAFGGKSGAKRGPRERSSVSKPFPKSRFE